MTAQPPSGETDAEARTRHFAWLNNQTARPPARIRETCEQHGRGVWQAIYGDDPAFTYAPLARVNPRAFHLAEAHDPEDQFVVVIQDLPRIGSYRPASSATTRAPSWTDERAAQASARRPHQSLVTSIGVRPDGRRSRTGSLAGCQRSQSPSYTQPRRTS
jgi:hypothetical protein